LFALPRIVRDLVKEAARAEPSLYVAAELSHADELVETIRDIPGRVAVVSGDSLPREDIGSIFRSHPDARVLELVEDGRDTFLYELRPHRVRLGQVSPSSLINRIRAPLSQAVVSKAVC